MPAWKDYQEEAAEFFRSLGLQAETDVVVKGIRTEHDVDVLVKLDVAGFKVTWVVECKHWKTAVTKLHVFALREIVSDLGADRGIILCEVGFQSGAVEAANLTNVQVTSLAALSMSSRDAVYAARLRTLYDRTAACRERYWEIPKGVRIKKGLRPYFGSEDLYSGARIVDASNAVLSRAFRGIYPIHVDAFEYAGIALPERLDNHEDVVRALEPLLTELEAKLASVDKAE
jgi:restriction system protein